MKIKLSWALVLVMWLTATIAIAQNNPLHPIFKTDNNWVVFRSDNVEIHSSLNSVSTFRIWDECNKKLISFKDKSNEAYMLEYYCMMETFGSIPKYCNLFLYNVKSNLLVVINTIDDSVYNSRTWEYPSK